MKALCTAATRRPTAGSSSPLPRSSDGPRSCSSLADVRRRAISDARPGATVQFDVARPPRRPRRTPRAANRDPSTNAPIVTPKPFEQFGASTRRILSELGYTEQEIATMITDRVVSERWTDEYLPN
ncbi:MAG: hypothetical protein R2713_14825 [Ilumatobacteraceae bacterium]